MQTHVKSQRLVHVQRHDHHHFHGWAVRLKRAGQPYQRYFRDKDDRRSSLARALKWRDRMLATLPPPRRFHRTSSRSTTGIVGVVHVRTHSRAGTPLEHFCALWYDEHGRSRKRSFSALKYGRQRARAMAADIRRRMLAEMLRPVRSR
jgi:hypothetical protein